MKRVAALILLSALSAKALAVTPFVVSDIRVEGLQRIAAGTVFSYLPIEKGDTLNDASAQQAIRALYRTGFFSDIELEHQGDILIVKVVERPSIAKLDIHGNKAIKTDDLKKGLKSIGLSEGSTFDRLALDRVRKELIQQYYNRGRYNVSVDPHVVRLNNNRVNIDIEIREGETARIKAINIVGNTVFTDKQIRSNFESDTTNWLSWYSKDDQYSREKVSGDLEKLGSYYMDRGYADFAVTSTQVAINPTKRDMYITASIKQGDVYKISDVHLLGDLILPEKTMRQFVFIGKGDTFNRARIQASAKAMKSILANIGYAFADVKPIPKLDKKNHTVDLTFYVKPGQRVYVRRITFSGNTRTEDNVLRREMRQLEGSWYSKAAIERSKTRLKQLGYFKDVKIDHKRVPGTDDEVDLTVTVKEQNAGSLQFGIGYSQYSGTIFTASVSQNNFLGTGDKFSVGVQTSRYYKSLNLRYVNPYVTDSGVSVGYNLSYSKTDFGDTNFANYENSTRAFSMFVGIPISESDRLTAGLGLESNRVNLYPFYSPQSYLDYQNALGYKTAHSWTFNTSYTHETRNAYWAPTAGGVQSLSLDVALPGSTVEYWKLYYRGNHYWPVGGGFVLYLNGEIGYGDTYGNQTYSRTFGPNKAGEKVGFPFWQNYFSGGVRDVRGFQDNTLGPRETSGYYYYPTPIGGSFKVLGTAQVFLPIPGLKNVNTARVALFTDVGNVYKDYKSFDASKLRASYGVSLQWQAPIGPLVMSYAIPFRDQPGDRHYEERFQFTFGSSF
ncbi:MAG TPA: outer membrane protein assembly factor BamA [Rhodanobacteraceae bacterium]|nr:outer membrane protein assembly factor BamA [Rhodanobacteraceae bacterium]